MTYEIDATKQSLGRVATKIATALRGKHTAAYDPSKLSNTDVVVTNINKINFIGSKLKQKLYRRHSGFPGGLKTRTLGDMWDKNPGAVVRHVVYGMLPKNRLRDRMITHLKFK
jgi:large subunit ribosomal protein L13